MHIHVIIFLICKWWGSSWSYHISIYGKKSLLFHTDKIIHPQLHYLMFVFVALYAFAVCRINSRTQAVINYLRCSETISWKNWLLQFAYSVKKKICITANNCSFWFLMWLKCLWFWVTSNLICCPCVYSKTFYSAKNGPKIENVSSCRNYCCDVW